MVAYEALWFALFPLNSLRKYTLSHLDLDSNPVSNYCVVGLGIPEETIAAIIFATNTAIYSTFVFCTIG